MDANETVKLLQLLNRLHPKRQQTIDRDSVLFWREVLKPWDYPTVRSAAIARARRNAYYPDATELAQMLPPPPTPEPVEEAALTPEQIEIREDIAYLHAIWERMKQKEQDDRKAQVSV